MKWRLGFAQRADRGVTTFLLPGEQAVRQGLAPTLLRSAYASYFSNQLRRAFIEAEANLPLQPFKREHDVYTLARRRSLSYIETAIPACFMLLYVAMLVAAIAIRST